MLFIDKIAEYFKILTNARMNASKKFLLSMFIGTIFGFSSIYAAGIDHFEVKLTPENAKVGEALDLEIKAVDKNDNLVNDYEGTILIFSESDPEAELPSALEENTYTFEASDEGLIKFENAVKFKEEGNQDIYIYDLDDDTVLGIGEAIIEKDEVQEDIEIEILSPENGLTIPEDSIKVSGTSKKNHSIKIIINGTQEVMTTTNNQGIFEKTIEELGEGENTFQAQILNADDEVVGESNEVKISVTLNLPRLKNLKISPESVEAENSFDVEIITNDGLSEVSVIINDGLTKLEQDERDETLWKKSIYAPEKAGNYQIDVIMKDGIGNEIKEVGAGSVEVKSIELKAAQVEEDTTEEANSAENEPELEAAQDIPQETNLEITGIKVVELKSKSIISWDKTPGAESYNIYKKEQDGKLEIIGNTLDPEYEIEFSGDKIRYDYFAIKAVGRKDDGTDIGEIYEGSLSDATKVKTGPEIILLFLGALLIGGFIFALKRKTV